MALSEAPGGPSTGSAVASVSAPPSSPVAALSGAPEALTPGSSTPTDSPSAVPDEPPAGDRIYAKSRFVWIKRAPGPSGWIGYLSLGGSVAVSGGDIKKASTIGPGCNAPWVRVEPTGFICPGKDTTFDPKDPEFVAIAEHAGKSAPYPYRYGESLGAPRYDAPPDPSTQRAREWDYELHQKRVATLTTEEALLGDPKADKRYKDLDRSPAGVLLPKLPPLSPLVREARPFVVTGSTVAWSKEYDDANGRTWLYTSDHAFVPKDRVKPYPETHFKGIVLSGPGASPNAPTLPIAYARKTDAPIYRREGDTLIKTEGKLERLAWAEVTEEPATFKGKRAWELRDRSGWLLEADLAVAEQRRDLPFEKKELPLKVGRTSWLDISVYGGTLVAYDGETPRYVTLISPGRGGTPIAGHDPVSTAATPTGTFRVDGKFLWATMVSSTDANVVHSEVQYVQNFHGPHALHGAYWHQQFGELKSGGCVNLSPIDSQWMFDWTEPALPKDWHGVRSLEDFGPPTRVRIRP